MFLPTTLVTLKRLNITFISKFLVLFARNKNKFANILGNRSNKTLESFFCFPVPTVDVVINILVPDFFF